MTEDQLQAQCFQWFYNSYPLLRKTMFAVPNGGSRNYLEAAKLKATGVTSGVHDLIWFYKNKLTTFELKVGYNSMSKDQIEFEKVMVENGAKCYEIRDFESFKNIVVKTII